MIDRLRKLLRAATPGPWTYSGDIESLPLTIAAFPYDGPPSTQWERNAALIVELRNHVAELLDAHDRMAGALRRIAEVLDQSGGDRFAIEARGVARAALGEVAP